MSLNWPLINSISLSIFIILILTRIIVWKYQSNNISLPYNTNHQFSEDKLLRETENEDQSLLRSYIYQPKNDENQIINQYMLVIEDQKKSLFIDYKKEKEHADTIIYIYNKKKKLINVFLLNDSKEKEYSIVIDLPEKSQYINIQLQNHKIPAPRAKKIKKPLNKIIILDSLTLLFGLFSLTYYIAYIVGGNKFPSYLLNNGIYVSLSLILLVCVINFLLMNQYRKKQKKVGE